MNGIAVEQVEETKLFGVTLDMNLSSCSVVHQGLPLLTSFRRKVFISGHFEPVMEPRNADDPDTQPV